MYTYTSTSRALCSVSYASQSTCRIYYDSKQSVVVMSRKKIHEKSPNLSGQKLSLLVGKTFAKKISLACLE